MRLYLLLAAVLLSGCVPTLVMPRQQEVAAQANSDLNAAMDYVVRDTDSSDSVKAAADTAKVHAGTMAKALELEELPKPRVGVNDWKVDPQRAYHESRSNASTDTEAMVDYGWKAAGLVGLALIVARAGQLALGNTPAGPFIAMLNSWMGGESPKKKKIHDKILCSLEDYKESDPNWKENKLYQLLSDRLTQREKDYIKDERYEL